MKNNRKLIGFPLHKHFKGNTLHNTLCILYERIFRSICTRKLIYYENIHYKTHTHTKYKNIHTLFNVVCTWTRIKHHRKTFIEVNIKKILKCLKCISYKRSRKISITKLVFVYWFGVLGEYIGFVELTWHIILTLRR